MQISILEDNQEHRAEMQHCLDDRFYQHECVFFNNARKMTEFLAKNLELTLVISLDHDLEVKSGSADPECGRDVAEFLAKRSPICPVVIHTTNSTAGDGMEFLLQDAQWETHRVHPWGDLEWIRAQWFRTMRNVVVGAARLGKPGMIT